jgi:2-oxoglutarate dehydrogenase E2 component (dihydrolipoamide succinyltransferase)
MPCCHGQVNAVIEGTDIIYRDYCDISIAVATPKGLVVPVLRDANKLDFAGVERVRLKSAALETALQGCATMLDEQY